MQVPCKSCGADTHQKDHIDVRVFAYKEGSNTSYSQRNRLQFCNTACLLEWSSTMEGVRR